MLLEAGVITSLISSCTINNNPSLDGGWRMRKLNGSLEWIELSNSNNKQERLRQWPFPLTRTIPNQKQTDQRVNFASAKWIESSVSYVNTTTKKNFVLIFERGLAALSSGNVRAPSFE